MADGRPGRARCRHAVAARRVTRRARTADGRREPAEAGHGTAGARRGRAPAARRRGREGGLAVRLGERKQRHAARSRLYRIGFAAAGLAVLAAGLAMLVLPGPGLLVTALALGMLALEFRWAERRPPAGSAARRRRPRPAARAAPVPPRPHRPLSFRRDVASRGSRPPARRGLCDAGGDADVVRTRARARLGARRQLGLRAGARRRRRDAAVLGPPAAAVRRHAAREPALGRRLRDRVGRLARVRRCAAARADLARPGDLRLRASRCSRSSRRRGIRAGSPGPRRWPSSSRSPGSCCSPLSLVGTQQIDHRPEPAEIALWLACVARRRGRPGRLGARARARGRARPGRGAFCSRAATSARSSSATAGRGSSPRSCSCSSTRSGRASCRAPSSTATRSPRRASRRSRRTPSRSPPASSSSARSCRTVCAGTLQLAAFASLVVSGALLSGVAARLSRYAGSGPCGPSASDSTRP